MRDRIDILGVKIDMVNMSEAMERMCEFLDGDEAKSVFTPNSEFIQRAYKQKEFADILNTGDLLIPDGIGVVYASRILKKPLVERVAGYDLTCGLFEELAKRQKSVFLFGSRPGVAQAAAQNIEKAYPGLVVAGMRDGYFEESDNEDIIKQINVSGAQAVLVCLGAYKQELWIQKHKDSLNCKILIGAGGTLDGLAGYVERAPESWRKHGLEWLYRLKKEPKRFWRMTSLPRFGITVLFRGKRNR